MTTYHVNVNNAHAFLFFIAVINYENILTTKISEFMVQLFFNSIGSLSVAFLYSKILAQTVFQFQCIGR